MEGLHISNIINFMLKPRLGINWIRNKVHSFLIGTSDTWAVAESHRQMFLKCSET